MRRERRSKLQFYETSVNKTCPNAIKNASVASVAAGNGSSFRFGLTG